MSPASYQKKKKSCNLFSLFAIFDVFYINYKVNKFQCLLIVKLFGLWCKIYIILVHFLYIILGVLIK